MNVTPKYATIKMKNSSQTAAITRKADLQTQDQEWNQGGNELNEGLYQQYFKMNIFHEHNIYLAGKFCVEQKAETQT